MNRKNIFLAAAASVLLIADMSFAGAVSVVNTKHNLSSGGSGTYKAASSDPAQGGTTEICIFCHTPHSGNTEAPLWNRAASLETYQTYTSDVLGVLDYPAAEDPSAIVSTGYIEHSKTRICLSCHDGTIALGKVVNMPSNIPDTYSEIQMSPGYAQIQQSAPGYIGINLRDDHPVAIKHDSTSDAELVPGASVAGSVRLYGKSGGKAVVSNANGNYVECTSCHNPHNSEFGNFLVETNAGSALCFRCHTKTGFSNSIHDTAGASYSPPTGAAGGNPATLGATVGGVKCMNCHFPHKAAGSGTPDNFNPNPNTGFGKYLLSFQEEKSCYGTPDRWGQSTAPCHGNNTEAQKTIIDLVAATKQSSHNVEMNNTSPLHEATEARSPGWLAPGNTNWHVECADCHNPHTAGNTSHTTLPPVPVVGGPTVITSSSSLYGTGGVQVNAAPTWAGGQGTYSYLEPKGVLDQAKTAPGVSYEYQICLKCHSEFAWRNSTAPNSPSFVPAAAMTDQAKEFGTAAQGSTNLAYHPVMGVGINPQGTLNAPWAANKGNQTMYCSDCHNSNLAPPQGPHGSGNNFILAAPFDDTQTANGTYQLGTDLCFTCHDSATYLTGAGAATGFRTTLNTNLHTRHYTVSAANAPPSTKGYKCVNCHIRVPHGWNARRAMVIIAGDAPGSVYEIATGPSITGFGVSGWPAAANYQDGLANKNANCLTVNGCHQ